MKKIYNTPEVEIVSMNVGNIMTDASILVIDEKGYSEYQGTDEFRSDWDNIWGEM